MLAPYIVVSDLEDTILRYAIVVAAGQGRRMGFKKQFLDLAGRPMWLRSVEVMLRSGASRVIVVTSADDIEQMNRELINRVTYGKQVRVVPGGATRHESVTAGMREVHLELSDAMASPSDVLVAVHDAARPFVQAQDIQRVYDMALKCGGALLGHYSRDTVKWVSDACVEETLVRERIFLAETPQVVRGDYIERAYLNGESSLSSTESPTDDSALLESLGVKVACVESTGYNGKVTTPSDLDYAAWLANRLWGSTEDDANWNRL